MYADWSSLTVQLQTLGTATQSVLAKLPPEDGKQVGVEKYCESEKIFELLVKNI